MWHKCLDGKWTYNSNITIQPHEIPFFINNTPIKCIICAYSENLLFKNNQERLLDGDQQFERFNTTSEDYDSKEVSDKKIDIKSLAKFVKRIQKYDQRYQPKSSNTNNKIDTSVDTKLTIYTDRIDSQDKDKQDVTRKSANRFGLNFAPSWDIINKSKENQIDFDTFKLLYVEEMKKSYVENNAAWFLMLSKDRIVLTCYCTDHEKCHRTILARDILPMYGAKYVGELSKESDLSCSSRIQDRKNIENQKDKKNQKKSSDKKNDKKGGNGQGSLF